MLSRAPLYLLAALIPALTGTAFAEQARDVSMGLASTSFATAPARIAKELGLYEKHGLEPRFTVMDNASAATTALISRSVNAALSGPGELVIAQARGQKVVVLANIYAGLSGSLVLSKSVADKLGTAPSAPIAERLKALDGLVIASPSATGAYTVALRGAAKSAGANIRFTYMALAAMPAALESGAVQGFIAGAPFWAFPIRKGSGILWISGPKAELPPENMPASSANLQVFSDFAAANPDWAKSLATVFTDLATAIDERPADVKAAVAKLYPDLDPGTVDLLFAAEAAAWKTKPATPADMARDIAFVKSIGTPIPQIDSIDPASMIYP
jgi:ABC-type nitrate/sulfonate/bicarbonate transport system substrate-binding protein